MARIVSELIYKLIADETELIKGLKKSEKDVESTAKKFTESGKKLTLGLTVPIVAAGAAMIKLASDTEDSINAVNIVFKEGADAVLNYGDIASETAGLSKTAFNDVANSFGVLLSMTTDDMDTVAADTITLTQRAADLASLLGGSTKDAAVALGAALRGETEPARRYGIILSEATVQAKALELGIGDVSGELTEAEKVQVRYNLILEQSSRAQGDFANTNDDTKNSAQVLRAQISNLTAELGEQLLPIVVEVLGGLRGLMSQFSELSDEQKRAILITAGVAAAIGPMLIGVGQAVTAVNTLKIAFTGLSVAGGPISLAIAGIAAASIALSTFIGNVERVKQAAQSKFEYDFTKDIATNTERLAAARALVNQYYRDAKGLSGAEATAAKAKADSAAQAYRLFEAQLGEQKKLVAETEAQERAQALLNKQKENEALLDEKKKATLKEVVDLSTSIIEGNATELESIQAQIDILNSSPVLKGQNEKDRLAAIEILKKRQTEISDQERLEAIQVADEVKNARILADTQYLENRVALSDQLNAISKENADFQIAEEERAKEEYRRIIRERINIAQGMFNQLTNIFSLIYQNELTTLNQRYDADVERINNSTMNEEERAAAIEQLDRELAIEEAKIKRKQAKIDKASSLVNIAISTSEAILKAYATLGPIGGLIASGIITALGITQASLIASQPLPEIPSFAQGGSFIVPPGFDGDNFPITTAFAKSGERVTVETEAQQASSRAITLQVGVLVADEAGLRELDRRLRDVGSFEDSRRG